MKKVDFLEELVDVLEIENEEVNYDTELALDSLQTLSIIAFLDENFDMQVKADILANVSAIKDLVSIIGENKIED